MKRFKGGPIKGQKQERGPLPFRYVLLISSVLFALLSLQGLWFVDQQLRPIISQIAHREMERIATYTIQQALTDELGQTDMNDMLITETNGDGQITYVTLDTQKYNKLLGNVQHRVHEAINAIQRNEDNTYGASEGTVATIPLGRALNNSLLNDVGPGIPLRFALIGDAKVGMKDESEQLGINNTRLSFYVTIEVGMDVILPFSETADTVSVELPAGFAFISGEVPQFYGGQLPIVNYPALEANTDQQPEEENDSQ
ncbi:sporulation protein YunB [Shouchella clausii]|jgi:sporulation protein YunB|uniref:Sporulation protein YunB n=3 Tax=Shouchella TaxID=2893057 RepID=Q5WDS3_SHOC1|nr:MULTISPECIES: sporulation protein YunB [Shouchella]MCM3313643.1 sporulation protein YunB [Psychrobacillus sp. MER TA 17]ALA54177.1 hypothetical protein DB29_03349 [Shouchella clausii]MBU3229276.1 sporulation protein YunB [Shouchella clausii]MBU3265502.1 sporulation protein YunB [Shouchella clausii]MBU3506176.1 sporulation protein YunB [Shouchella clausii]